uniref:Uncharacterized protein n=1 Tax=Strongyloides stercoralis TaxID=6248 RepID=A0AAF5DCF7_STRER
MLIVLQLKDVYFLMPSDDTDTVCVEVCRNDVDCFGAPCTPTPNPDIDGRTDFNTCPIFGLQCSNDAQCAPLHWSFYICNTYTLFCLPDPTAMTTERPIITEEPVTTAPPCNDKVVGGFRHNLFVLIQMLF